jgi:hypothetical protein
MRWQDLFADLEAQASSLERADEDQEIAERTRGELAHVSLLSRLRANVGRRITVRISGAGELSGQLQRVGADWLLIATTDEIVVPLAALLGVVDLSPSAVSDEGVSVVASRLRMTSVLRSVARDRSAVRIVLRDGSPVFGTLDRVGADFVDVAVHDLGEAPRPRQVRSRATLALAAIACVRRQPTGWN